MRPWLDNVFAAAELVRIAEPIVARRDPKDEFLELAVSGRADLIVSGDADLLAHPFRGIPIITPAVFARRG